MTSKNCCGNCKYWDSMRKWCKKHDGLMNYGTLCTGWEDTNYVVECGACEEVFCRSDEAFYVDDARVCESCFAESTALKDDEVNHPKHYTQLPIECKDVIKHFDACRGQAIKYIWRCEDKSNRIQDLEKAIFWIKEKIKMYQEEDANR